jgi:integrase
MGEPANRVGAMARRRKGDWIERGIDPLFAKALRQRTWDGPSKRIFIRDDDVTGLAVQVTPTNHHSFVFDYRRPNGRTNKLTFPGDFTPANAKAARKWAFECRNKVQAGIDPDPRVREPAPATGPTLIQATHAFLRWRGQRFKSDPQLLAQLENHAFETLGHLPMMALKPGMITRLADDITAKVARKRNNPDAGRAAAHGVVKALNVIGNWYAKRNDDFMWKPVESPLTKEDREGRERVLEDHEIVAIWHACERQGHPHGPFVQFLLLTALRRNEAAELRRSEVVDGVIRLPPERVKTKVALVLPLSQAALDVLASCPEGEWYFTGERDPSKHFSAFARGKAALDAMLNVEHWTLHDCRRTAATLMERAGVLPHVIEATLNHKVGGVAGVYRRHNFVEEKKAAMEGLAQLLTSIVK